VYTFLARIKYISGKLASENPLSGTAVIAENTGMLTGIYSTGPKPSGWISAKKIS
jgi:hypothetical protein